MGNINGGSEACSPNPQPPFAPPLFLPPLPPFPNGLILEWGNGHRKYLYVTSLLFSFFYLSNLPVPPFCLFHLFPTFYLPYLLLLVPSTCLPILPSPPPVLVIIRSFLYLSNLPFSPFSFHLSPFLILPSPVPLPISPYLPTSLPFCSLPSAFIVLTFLSPTPSFLPVPSTLSPSPPTYFSPSASSIPVPPPSSSTIICPPPTYFPIICPPSPLFPSSWPAKTSGNVQNAVEIKKRNGHNSS